MKKIFILITIILPIQLYCQAYSFITGNDASFDWFFEAPNDLQSGANNPCQFCLGLTGSWQASHNSPQIWLDAWGNPSSAYDGHQMAFLQGAKADRLGYDEGIFFPFNFRSDRYYTLTFYSLYGSRFSVKLATGLQNNVNGNGNPTGGKVNDSTPDPATTEILFDNYVVTGGGWQKIQLKNFRPSQNFTQLWFHSSADVISDAVIDGVSLTQSCCIPIVVYQDTINPPSTYVGEQIVAGRNVIPFAPQGDVTFTQPWHTTWQAGLLDSTTGKINGKVVLKHGFKSGENFTARVRDCLSSPLELNLSYSVQPLLPGQQNCFMRINADLCFGSGNYSFTARDLSTNQLLSGSKSNNGATFAIFPSEETEYEVTVTDLENGQTKTQRIKVGRCGCSPPRDVPGINKINKICGNSVAPDCFTIGKKLQTNSTFTWTTDFPGGMAYMQDANKEVTTVCIPPTLGGSGIITYKLITQKPGCPDDTSEFHIIFKRQPTSNCYWYNGFWGPTSLNENNLLQLHFDISLDIEAIYIELYEESTNQLVYSTELVRGVEIAPLETYTRWEHTFGNTVNPGPYRIVMSYKCRCSDVINPGKVRIINFN